MRIGIDIRPLMTAPRTGVGEYTFELLDSIFKIDRDNQYFLYYNSGKDTTKNIPDWKYENVKIISSRLPNKIFNASLKIFGRPKLDRLVAESLDIWFSPNLNFTSLSPGIKSILTVHDLSFEFFPEFSTAKQFFWHKAIAPKKQCERADLILTPSENTKKDIVDYYKIDPQKIKVIYPGIKMCHCEAKGRSNLTDNTEIATSVPAGLPRNDNIHNIKHKYNLPENYILFLGAIEPRKNIIGLIEAFESHCEEAEGRRPPERPNGRASGNPEDGSNHPHSLVIAGAPGWKNEKIFERIKKSKFSERIKILGFVPDEDKAGLYALAKLFVYPSFYEGFGFPVLEAMQAGVPVIASNRSSLPEIAGPAVYLIDPSRPNQIVLAMNELINNEKLREWHIKKGHEQTQKFNWQDSAKEWLNAIAQISRVVASRLRDNN